MLTYYSYNNSYYLYIVGIPMYYKYTTPTIFILPNPNKKTTKNLNIFISHS